ncbi:leucine-rich repeat protein [Prevotella melaninogenica]|uniref:leucine-rich repeat domain-containing protein n=1 Tax=Prevotella melaninogenica TaxID=28132 RepID=UPI0028E20C07|nr:leucine-rich repeat protein [Prevotella melaninogenica]
MKRFKFLLFVLLALLYVTNASALIVNDTFTRDGNTYRVTKMDEAHDGIPKTYNVAFVSSTNTTVNIPATVADPHNQYTFNVTAIANNSTVPNATSVTMPNTIVSIEANAFKGGNITNITIPKSVTEIKSGAFGQMSNLTAINVDAANPNFRSDNGVLIEKKESKEWVAAYPMAKPDVEYTVPEGVYGVYTNAFQRAAYLTKITLPASLKESPSTAEFNGYTSAQNLKEIAVAAGNTAFKSVDGVLLSADGKKLIAYPNGKAGSPSTNPAYQGVTGQPNASVYKIPDGVESIEQAAFAQVNGLTAIELNGVKKLAKGAFDKAVKLRNVLLGPSVDTIEDGAFGGNNDLAAFDVDPANPNYAADNGVIYTKNKEELVLFPAGKAGEYTTLPTTKKIRNRAFYYAQKVTKVTFNSNLEVIDNDAFQATTKLENITFEAPAKIKTIGTFAFQGSGITELNIPASLQVVSWSAFGSTKLKKVTVADGSQLQSINTGAFNGCKDLEEFTFEGSSTLNKIQADAFSGDDKLKSFVIPEKVTVLERGAFNGASGLETITFKQPATMTVIGEGAFQNAKALKRIELPSTVTTISKDAFNTCSSLTEVVIPASVTTIDATGFQECAKLEKFTVDKNNTVYSSVDGFLLSKDKKKLVSFPPAKANTYYTMLPPTIETIGKQAFYFVQALENVTIPEKVKKIEDFAFDRVGNLNTIAFLGKTPITDVAPSAFNPANVDKSKIDLSVRKDAKAAFDNDALWSQFRTRGISFFKETNGTGNGTTEYFPLSQKAVMIVGTEADVYTYVVEPTVTDDNGKSYQVRLWGDYAMNDNTTNIQEVVFKNTLDYVGLDAFKKNDGSSTVKRIYFTATVPTKDMSATKWEYIDNSGNYTQKEFEPSLKVYVKKSAENAYKTATGWDRYAGQTSYKIPGEINIAHWYGTFAREFDADLGIYARENNEAGRIGAFITQTAGMSTETDAAGVQTTKFIMKSINYGNTHVTDYDYVPAETGVLLESRSGASTPADFYYAIGEKDNVTYSLSNNIMEGVTVKDTKKQSSTSDPIFAMTTAGIFKPLKIGTDRTIPVHKAVARPKVTLSGSAKVMFVFDDGENHNIVNAIETVKNNNVADNNAYYNLQGQRVENPQHGVFIHNGKKVVLK